MGDSITDGWKLAEFFPGKPYVNRGISGQTTPQMLVRMYSDVIALKPAAVVILAGTNDIARNTGPETLEMIQQNFMAMTELAQGHGIRVVLCALTPISDYPVINAPAVTAAGGGRAGGPPRRRQTEVRPPADIR
jgi:acyl-CoA thioesterase-1